MIGPSQRRLTSWEKRCHVHDFGPFLNDGTLFESDDGGLLLVSEQDAAVASFSEIEAFCDATFETLSVGLSTAPSLNISRNHWEQNGKVGSGSRPECGVFRHRLQATKSVSNSRSTIAPSTNWF